MRLNLFNKHHSKNSNSPNFFVYAIREIILVVIGILIAVSINNCNESRKNNKELNQILDNVKIDLQNDIQKIDKIIAHYDSIRPIFEKVIKSEYTEEDYINSPKIGFIILGYPELAFNQGGLLLLEDFKGDIKPDKESLTHEIIQFYKEQLWEIKVDDDLRSKDYKENFTYWKNNFDWWIDFVQLNITKDFIDYAIDNDDYKKRVATAAFFAYKVYIPELEKFKKRATQLIRKIEGINL